MRQSLLSRDDVLTGYTAVSQLYPYIPSMNVWRAWEYAAYQRYTLPEPVLDIGCGDGRFFRLVWPQLRDVVGVEMDDGVAEAARRSGVYREVIVAPAHQLSTPPQSFASAFANCALEHMPHLSEVLRRVCLSVRPGGSFVLSVVTDKFRQWVTLPLLLEQVGEPTRAQSLRVDYETYHHLVNPLPPQLWREYLEEAGFEVVEHLPIVPEVTTRLFLFIDHLWHVRRSEGAAELGETLLPYLATLPDFPQAFRLILDGAMRMERDWSTGSGAVFWARRRA